MNCGSEAKKFYFLPFIHQRKFFLWGKKKIKIKELAIYNEEI